MSRELTPQEIAERSLIKTYRKSIWNPFIAAVKRYELVSPGDKIAVCISGGKDSVMLAKLMQELQRHTDRPFELVFMVMDPGYKPENRNLIEDNAALLGIPITIFDSDIFNVTVSAEKNPCYLCARMRRGFLYAKAQELGCNKIALGHNRDDIIETFMMSLIFEARISTFQPVSFLEKKKLFSIRPLMYVPESDIKGYIRKNNLPIIKNPCPANGNTKRQEMKDLIKDLCRKYDNADTKIFNAISRSKIDGWSKE